MPVKPLSAEVAADRAAAMAEYQAEKIAAIERMAKQKAARLAQERSPKRGKSRPTMSDNIAASSVAS